MNVDILPLNNKKGVGNFNSSSQEYSLLYRITITECKQKY